MLLAGESPPTLSAQKCTPARTGRPTAGFAPAPVVSGVPRHAGPSIGRSLYHNPAAIVQEIVLPCCRTGAARLLLTTARRRSAFCLTRGEQRHKVTNKSRPDP